MESPAIRSYGKYYESKTKEPNYTDGQGMPCPNNLKPHKLLAIPLLSGLFWIDRTSKKESKTKLHNSDLVFFYVRELLHKKIAFINVITPLAPV